MRITIFGGGRGCTNIIKSLYSQTDYSVTFIVNAYDNGKSTGRIRKFVPGLLGPSDIRKNVSTLLECDDKTELADFLEFRLNSSPNGVGLISFIRSSIPTAFATLTFAQYEVVVSALSHFETFESSRGRKFDTQDCAVGNLLIAGLFLQYEQNFNQAIKLYQEVFLTGNARFSILNVSDGENLFLVAKSESGIIFTDESEIVSNEAAESIREIGLIPFESAVITDSLFEVPYQPKSNPEVLSSLIESNIIIYGPGTQASSLLPSYLTRDLLHTIISNKNAVKIFISNLVPDYDDPVSNVTSRLNSFLRLSEKVIKKPEMSHLITHVFSELPLTSSVSNFIAFSTRKISFQTDDWLVQANKHLGPAIVRQIAKAVGSNFNFKPGFVSLIIAEPSCSVELSQLVSLTRTTRLGLDFEIILVHNSLTSRKIISSSFSDETGGNDLQHEVRAVNTLENALRISRGDLIAYLENPNLYSISDLFRGIGLMQGSTANLVIGSRNLKILDLKKQVRSAYPGQPIRGFVAYWGSLSLSLSFLFKYKRFISDPLAGVKIIRQSALADCNLGRIGQDININLLKIFVEKEYLIEQYEIDYRPENLTRANRHSFKQGFVSLSRIWTNFF